MSANLTGRLPAFAVGLFVSLAALADSTSVSIGDGSVTGVTGQATIEFPVTRSGDLSHDLYVDWYTQDGTAQAGTHYSGTSGRLKMIAGNSTAPIPVSVAPGSGAALDFQVILERAGAAGGAPTFDAPQALAVAGEPLMQLVADLNGDGRPDVVSPSGPLVVAAMNLTPAGASTVSALPYVLPITGADGMWLAAADFNGDGQLDLVTSSDLDPAVRVHRNGGAPGSNMPSFSAAATLVKPVVPSNPQTRNIAIGDVNLDGLPDILGWQRDTAYAFVNTTTPGAALFTFSDAYEIGTSDTAVVNQQLVDLNGDGFLDLLQLRATGLSVRINLACLCGSAPDFDDPVDIPLPTTTAAPGRHSVAVGDFDGDGRQDLAYGGSYPASATVVLNRIPPGEYLPDASMFLAVSTPVEFAEQVTGIDAADVNGDGKVDLTAWYVEPISVARRSQVLVSTTPPGGIPGFDNQYLDAASSFRFVDFNSDGRPDLLDVDGGNLSVRVSTTPTPAPAASFAVAGTQATGTAPRAVGIADFNGDGVRDVIAVNSGTDDLSLFLNQTPAGASTATFSGEVIIAPTGPIPRGLAIADFNHDGLRDAAVADSNCESVSVAFNFTFPGGGPMDCFFLPFAYNTGPGSSPVAIAAGDLNGDGLADIVTANSGTPDASILMNLGTDSFYPFAEFADLPPQSVGLTDTASGIAIGDTNRDGKPDLVASLPFQDRVAVLLGAMATGSTTASFGTPQLFDVGDDPQSVSIADVNGDRAPDIVTANLSGSISVLLNQTAVNAPTPAFAIQSAFATIDPRGVALGDVNGDGRADIIVANGNFSAVGLMLNTTAVGAATATFAAVQTYPVTGSVHGVALGDLNGDGKPDIATAESTANQVSILFNTQFQAIIGDDTATGTISYGTAGPPAVWAIERVGDSPTSDSLVAFRVDFSETVSGVDVADFSIATTGISGAFVDSVTNFGLSSVVYVNTGTGSGTVRLDLADDDSISGQFSTIPLGGAGTGNGDFSGETFSIDRTGPAVDIVRGPGQDASDSTQPVHFIATFSEAVVDFEDYPLNVFVGGYPAKAQVSDATGGGTTYDLYVSDIRANGSVGIVLLGGEAHDAYGNASDAASSSESVAYSGLADAPVLDGTAFSTRVELDWDDVAGADSYSVYVAGSPIPLAAGLTQSDHEVPNLVNGVAYEFFVTAVNTAGESVPSNTVSLTPQPPSVNLSISSGTIAENGGSVTLTATLSEIAGAPVKARIGFKGNASKGIDYTPSDPLYLTIPAGSLTGTLTITALQDGIYDAGEVIRLTLANLNGPAIAGAITEVRTTFVDDEAQPVATLSTSAPSLTEGGVAVQVTVNLDVPVAVPTTIKINYDGKATRGNDYNAPSSVVIAGGASSASFNVSAVNDSAPEADEPIRLRFASGNQVSVGTPSTATITLVDNDGALPVVTLSSGGTSLSESGGSVALTAALSAPVPAATTITLGFEGAVRGTDFSAPLQITIPANGASAGIFITGIDDALYENETLKVRIVSAVHATPGTPSLLSLTMVDNDPAPIVTLAFDAATLPETGGSRTLTATLSAPAPADSTIVLTYTGSALGADYTAVSSIPIAAGATTGSVVIAAKHDTLDEGNETIKVSVGAGSNAVAGVPATATTTILDDD